MLKRFSFIGDGLSHVVFGAMAIAAVLQITNKMPLVMVITILSAVLLLRTGQNTKIKGDAAIAMISVGALAIGYLLMNLFSTSSNLSGDVCSTLFGSTSILTLSPAEVWLCVGMSVLVVAVFILLYNKIFAVTFDENFARATGTKAGLYNLLIAVVVVEHYDEMCIGTDEHFRFHCKQCGKCCINREDILLNSKDLYNISKELGLAPRDTIAQYCEVYLGQNSRIPIVRLKPRGSIKRCPLLRDRKCSVHNAKPTVCALFPLGRSIKLDAKETDPNAIERARIQYIINPIECGDRSEEHTVREWVESFGIPIHDNDFIAWQKALFSVRQQIVELEKMLPDKSMERVWSITYQALYLNYDIQEDFRKQFQKNSDRLIDALEQLPALWKELSHE